MRKSLLKTLCIACCLGIGVTAVIASDGTVTGRVSNNEITAMSNLFTMLGGITTPITPSPDANSLLLLQEVGVQKGSGTAITALPDNSTNAVNSHLHCIDSNPATFMSQLQAQIIFTHIDANAPVFTQALEYDGIFKLDTYIDPNIMVFTIDADQNIDGGTAVNTPVYTVDHDTIYNAYVPLLFGSGSSTSDVLINAILLWDTVSTSISLAEPLPSTVSDAIQAQKTALTSAIDPGNNNIVVANSIASDIITALLLQAGGAAVTNDAGITVLQFIAAMQGALPAAEPLTPYMEFIRLALRSRYQEVYHRKARYDEYTRAMIMSQPALGIPDLLCRSYKTESNGAYKYHFPMVGVLVRSSTIGYGSVNLLDTLKIDSMTYHLGTYAPDFIWKDLLWKDDPLRSGSEQPQATLDRSIFSISTSGSPIWSWKDSLIPSNVALDSSQLYSNNTIVPFSDPQLNFPYSQNYCYFTRFWIPIPVDDSVIDLTNNSISYPYHYLGRLTPFLFQNRYIPDLSKNPAPSTMQFDNVLMAARPLVEIRNETDINSATYNYNVYSFDVVYFHKLPPGIEIFTTMYFGVDGQYMYGANPDVEGSGTLTDRYYYDGSGLGSLTPTIVDNGVTRNDLLGLLQAKLTAAPKTVLSILDDIFSPMPQLPGPN